jgi:hypothetical protein
MISVCTHIDYEPDRSNWHRFLVPKGYIVSANDWLMTQAIGSARITVGFFRKYEEEDYCWDDRGDFYVVRLEADRDAVLFKLFHSDELLSEIQVLSIQKYQIQMARLIHLREQNLISATEFSKQLQELSYD